MDIIKRAAQELKDRVNKTSQVEKLLQEATSKENWQAHPKTLNTIAEMTNSSEEWQIISKYLWEKLQKADKSWIVTFKSLVLIEYLLKNGSPRCIMEFKDELYKIRKLQDFQFMEGGEDKAASVRQRSKNIVDLLTDQDKLDHERQTAKELREKMSSVSTAPQGGYGSSSNTYGSASSSTYGSSSSNSQPPKYAGYSKDSFKDQKYSGFSSKDTPVSSYAPGDSYDVTEFKGLEKYRKKEENQPSTTTSTQKEEEKKQPVVVPVIKPPENSKISITQVKIQPPSSIPTSTVQQKPVTQQQPAKSAFDLFEDDAPAPQQPSQEEDWSWSNAPTTTAPKQTVQAPVQINSYPQTFVQQPNIQQQQQNQYQLQQQQQQQIQQANIQQQQFNIQQKQQIPQYQQQVPLSYQAPKQNVTVPVQNNNADSDLFDDFVSSEPAQKPKEDPKNYSKKEFDLIDLGGLKTEVEKKQKEKESKNQNSNDFGGFSTLNTQLDSFSISGSSTLNQPTPTLQSNYAALNNIGWGQQGYGAPSGFQNGAAGYPNMQGGYPNAGGFVQPGYPPQVGGYVNPQQGYGTQVGYGAYGYPVQNNRCEKENC